MSINQRKDSVLDKPLTFTYHTQASATGLTKVAGVALRQQVKVRSIFS